MLRGLSARDAVRALPVVLGEVGRCLTWGEAQNLADQLPDAYASSVRARAAGSGRRYSLDAFIASVAEQLHVTPAEARRQSVAVLAALRDVLSSGRLQHVPEELDRFSGLTGPPPGADTPP